MGNRTSRSKFCEVEAKTLEVVKAKVESVETFLKQRTISELVPHLPKLRKDLDEISSWLKYALWANSDYGIHMVSLIDQLCTETCPIESIRRESCICKVCMGMKSTLYAVTVTRSIAIQSLDPLHEWKINLTLMCRRLEKELPAGGEQ